MITMSEDRSRFKIKKGDIEIEYEGKSAEANTRYKEAFEWIKTVTVAPSKREPLKEEKKEPKKKEEPEKKKEDRRGGLRARVISPAIDELIKEGFFDNFKNISEVFEELRRKTVPVSGTPPIINALNRRVKAKKLDRTRDEQGQWVYGKKQSSTGG